MYVCNMHVYMDIPTQEVIGRLCELALITLGVWVSRASGAMGCWGPTHPTLHTYCLAWFGLELDLGWTWDGSGMDGSTRGKVFAASASWRRYSCPT